MVRKFRKKPVVVEAMKFDAGSFAEIVSWIEAEGGTMDDGTDEDEGYIGIETLEGTMAAREGEHWIIRDLKGFYPCANYIFEASYEEADANGSG